MWLLCATRLLGAKRHACFWSGPKSARLLDRKLDLVILQRHCVAQGAQLGLVTDNPLIIEYSRELSIPVFETVAEAQRKPWRRGRRRNYVFSFSHYPHQRNTCCSGEK